ncbi:hypothetical protein [Zunongwangia endophytica]|uniref:Uncharacterized protein n=1 Tax=Zunongwangia endophytica TaxID=1808945 RepID=A0ABV8H889_9FLAO|nr:hypothetical protein [Zunongwangia endophytica]MDN3596023.1 hypothetical protein [Zunongwangia endophytica]
MSMTLINFVQKSKLPTKTELEDKIKEIGYDFKFLNDFEKFDDFNQIDSIDCVLNGNQTFVEIYFNPATEIISDFPNLKKDLSDKDFGISFTSGSDELVSACISIISVGLIDLSESVVLYADEEKLYSRKMLIQDISNSLEYNTEETNRIIKKHIAENLKCKQTWKKEKRNKKLTDIVLWSLLIIGMVLMNKKIISWHIPCFLLILVLIKSIIENNKERKYR